ncbi:MAG: carbon monoxide dehydrogenase subunit G [Burkholderiales bacterium]|nr:carbon monoxide dehydrogenase subunit G [Burkholderiales bacterium]
MELSGNKHISAPPAVVWRALNDPGCLARCIPSCEYVERVSDTETTARVLMRVGPVRALFVGRILMSDVRPDQGCTMTFEGSGGAAGFAKGESSVNLAPADGGTLLSYTASASVGGKLGQVGGRMIDAFAKKMADEFFSNLQLELRVPPAEPSGADPSLATSSVAVPAAVAVTQVTPGPIGYGPAATGSAGQTPEGTRVLWFLLGAGAVALGFCLAHWLR